MKFPAYWQTFFALLVTVLFSGCSTKWSQSDRDRLRAVSVLSTTAAKDAYHKPDATDSPGWGESIPRATGGGLIPALIGSAIDANVMARQQRKFEESNLQYFEAIKKAMPAAPTAEVTAALKNGLGRHDFFGSRMTEQPTTTTFTAEILHYGLQKSALSKGDDILLRVRIIAKITLKLPDGSTFFECQATGVSPYAKHAAEIVETPDFMTEGYLAAARDVFDQLHYKLIPKL